MGESAICSFMLTMLRLMLTHWIVSLNPRTMEIFEDFGIHDKITKLWEPATDEAIWYRNEAGNLSRAERYRSQPPPGVRCVLKCLFHGLTKLADSENSW